MPEMIRFMFIAMLLSATTAAHADTLHVPGDHDTIFEAISAASNGDTIIVHPGTYREGPIDFRGKSLSLVADQGPEFTSIVMNDGAVASVISIVGSQDSAVISGFTISGGVGTDSVGGGIRVEGFSSVLVEDCIIQQNYADLYGGGIYANVDSQMTIRDTRFIGNISSTSGGGAHLDCNDLARLSRCEFLGNFAGVLGGGLYIGSEFAWKKMAQLYADSCVFSGNIAASSGGAMAAKAPAMVTFAFTGAINCTFSGNVSPNNPVVTTVPTMGDDAPMIQNSIISNNVGSQMISGLSSEIMDFPPPRFDACLIDTVNQEIEVDGHTLIGGVAGFVDEFGFDGIAGTGDENFELTPLSTAIDRGVVPVPPIEALDLYGNSRYVDDPLVLPNSDPGPLDLGAVEFDIASVGGSVAIWNGAGQSNIQFTAGSSWYDGVVTTPEIPGFIRLPGTQSHALVSQQETVGTLLFDGGTMYMTAPNGPADNAALELIDSGIRPGFLLLRERPGESTFVFLRDIAIQAGSLDIGGGELAVRNASISLDNGSIVISPIGELTLSLGTSLEMGGTIQPAVRNNGILRVDGSQMDASYSQAIGGTEEDITPPGTLVAEISANDDSSSPPKLDLTGNAVLGGTLGISSPDSAPALGEVIPILSAPLITQEFDLLYTDGLPDGLALHLNIVENVALGTSDITVEVLESTDTTFGDIFSGPTYIDGIEDSMLVDVDNDGDDDLILSLTVPPGMSFGYVVALENLGPGSGGDWMGFDFIQIGINTVKISGSANGFSVADLDNDNLVDIIVANKTSGTVHLLQNNSSGGAIDFSDVFSIDASPDLPAGIAQPIDTWAGDLDDDGLRDVVVTNETDGSIVAFKNTSSFLALALGTGTKSVPKRFVKVISPTGTGSPRDESPAGVGGATNGDGTETEGAEEDDESTGTVQTGKVDSSFLTGIRLEWFEHEVGQDPVDIAIEDLNGDGLRDIVTANDAGESVSILLGSPLIDFEPALTIPVGASCKSVGLGDFDGDGDLDIALLVDDSSSPSSVRVIRNDTDLSGVFSFCLENDSLFEGNDAFKINTGNLNEDGFDDILVQALTPPFAGLGGSEPTWIATHSGVAAAPCIGDLDKSGNVDAVDLAFILGAWGSTGPGLPEDLNEDNVVDATDLALLLGAWGACNGGQLED